MTGKAGLLILYNTIILLNFQLIRLCLTSYLGSSLPRVILLNALKRLYEHSKNPLQSLYEPSWNALETL